MGFGLVIGFTGLLQLVTTSNYNRSQICTVYNSLKHMLSLLSLPCLHQALLGNGSQHRKFLSFRVQRPYWPATVSQHLFMAAKSELLYDWRFTANQFVLAPSLLRHITRVLILQLNPYGHSPCVTPSLKRGWVSLLNMLCLCTYSMILKIIHFTTYTNPLSVQALQGRSCLSYLA
jgi:hypothetical protein